MNVTLKQILIAVFFAALAFAAMDSITRSWTLDPDTERFFVNNEAFSPRWKSTEFQRERESVFDWNKAPFEARGPNLGISYQGLNQEIIHYSYLTKSGRLGFDVVLHVEGRHTSDWKFYRFFVLLNGSSRTNASCKIRSSFDPPSKVLKVSLTQRFDEMEEARHISLLFVWDGSKFVRLVEAEPDDALESPS